MTDLLTSVDVSDLRRSLGGWNETWQDEELQRIALALDPQKQHDKLLLRRAILGWCFEELMARQARYYDASVGSSNFSTSQIWEHLQKLAEVYRPDLDAIRGRAVSGTTAVRAALRSERDISRIQPRPGFFSDDSTPRYLRQPR